MAKRLRKYTTAEKIISAELRKTAKEALGSDTKIIADLIGKEEDTVRSYLKGNVGKFNTASVILKELRVLIKERTDFAMELVA